MQEPLRRVGRRGGPLQTPQTVLFKIGDGDVGERAADIDGESKAVHAVVYSQAPASKLQAARGRAQSSRPRCSRWRGLDLRRSSSEGRLRSVRRRLPVLIDVLDLVDYRGDDLAVLPVP